MRAKKLLKISSLRWASARLSPSMYVMGFCQGFIANISRSTRASVRSSAFLHMPNACVSDESLSQSRNAQTSHESTPHAGLLNCQK